MPTAQFSLSRMHLLLLLGVVVLLGFRLYTGAVFEDALITYRYAGNLARGHGFVFNDGERVLGTTTPLFAITLSLAAALLGPWTIPYVAVTCATLAYLASGILLHSTLRHLQCRRLVCDAVLAGFLLHPDTLWSTAGGMETTAAVLGMVGSWWSIVQSRFASAAVIAGFLVLVRIDGAVWACLLGLWMVSKDWRRGGRAIVVGLAITAPWFIFATAYFGSPLPHTMVAKRLIANTLEPLSIRDLVTQADWFAQYLGALFPVSPWLALPLYALGSTTIFASGERRLWPPAAFPILFSAALYLGRAPHFNWYLVPIVWCSLLTSIIGLWVALSWVGTRFSGSNARMATVALSGILLVGFAWKIVETARYHRSYQINEEGLRKRVGLWLRAHTRGDSTVAMEAIGYQGFFSERRVIDLAGLVSPAVVGLKRSSASNAELFHSVIEQLAPDAVVLRSFEVDDNRHFHGGPLFETNAQRTDFNRWYHEAARFGAPLPQFWGKMAYLTVYVRNR